MKNSRPYIEGMEEFVLITINALLIDAHGVVIQKRMKEVSNRSVSTGALYAILGRLEEKGFIRSRLGTGTPVKGSRRRVKRFYSVTREGDDALKEAELARFNTKLPRMRNLGLDGREFGLLVECSIRCALSQRSYLPGWLNLIILPNLNYLKDYTLSSLISLLDKTPLPLREQHEYLTKFDDEYEKKFAELLISLKGEVTRRENRDNL